MADHPLRWLVLAGVWLHYFCFGLGIAGLAPLVSVISRDLALSAAQMGSVLGAWQFVYIFAALPCGFALQRFGPSRMLTIGALLIAASGLLRSLAGEYLGLLLAVALFGLGGPIISAGAPQTVSRWFTGSQRGLAMGVYITGPALGGVVTYSLTHSVLMPLFDNDWRHILRLWAGAALLAALVWAAIATLAARAGEPAASSAGSGSFDLSQVRALLRERNVVLLLAIGIGVFIFDHGLRNWLPELIRSYGNSAETAGYLATVPVVMGVAGALVFPRLATPERRIRILVGLFAMAGAASLLMQSSQPVLLVPGLVLAGLASGAMMTVAVLTLMEQRVVGPALAGLAGGLYFTFAEIGGVSGPLLLGIFYDMTGGFALGLSFLTVTCAVLVALAMRIR